MEEKLKDYLIKEIKEIEKILNKAEKEIQTNNTLETKILNIEFFLGKWHGLMEVLSKLDFIEYINIIRKTEPTRKKLLKFVEKIYK